MGVNRDALRVVFVIKSLQIQGGAERVLVSVASGLAERGHQVTVVTNDLVSAKPSYSMHQSVQLINLGVRLADRESRPLEVMSRIFVLRRFLEYLRPEVAVGFMHSTYIPLGLALWGTGIPLLASEHTSFEHYKNRLFQRILLNLTPLWAKKITVVSEQIKKGFPPWLRKCMTVIPNPVGFEPGKRSDCREENRSCKTLLSVGRLSKEKNHKLLIASFATIAKELPDWNLRIVGEGGLRIELLNQISKLGLVGRVFLPGSTKDIDCEFQNAQIVVLPSSYESFGLVAAEAIYHGLPVVGFADCSGINLLIKHNENGILVEGVNKTESLALALKSLMLSPTEISRLGSSTSDWLTDEYGINNVLDKWEFLLNEIRD